MIDRTLHPIAPDDIERLVADAICSASPQALRSDDVLVQLAAGHIVSHLAAAGLVTFRIGVAPPRPSRIATLFERARRGVAQFLMSLSDVLPSHEARRV